MTNNLAEYTALLRALERVRDLEIASDLEVRGDSQLVINQATGEWSCNALNLRPLLARVHELTRGLRVAWHWVPREQNSEADALSRRAYHDARSGPAHQSRQARPGHAL
jgi:ribonuclease HI